jgi:hypothetical protein
MYNTNMSINIFIQRNVWGSRTYGVVENVYSTLVDLVLRATYSSNSNSESLESFSTSSSSTLYSTIGRLRGLPRGLFSVDFNSASRTFSRLPRY